MTTKITVDAHAGWPVSVKFIDRSLDGDWIENSQEIVQPKTIRNFYVFDTRKLMIEEISP